MTKFVSGLMTAGGAAALLTAFGGGQAFAQTQAPEEETQPDEIVVTGSNIRGASDSGAIAVTVMGKDQLDAYGQPSTGEIFENLAQAGSFEINSSSDGPNDARGDIATVNLRGLGTGNTLILLNGRRLAAHGVNQDIGSTPRQVTNVNAFPSSGIDRVEVLRDGASALYGSDATAGVVNTILTADPDGTRLSLRGSFLEGTGSRDLTADLSTGFSFNDDKTRVIFVGSYYTRDGLFASELGPQFNTVDKRGILGENPYGTETTDFRNTSTSSPFGQYQAGDIVDGVFVGQRVRQGGTSLTNAAGVFHIQPCGFNGTRADLADYGEGCMGLDDGNLDTALRYDFGANQPNNALDEGVNISNDAVTALGRQLISDAQRINAYTMLEHDFNNELQGFAEALFYRSSTDSNRAAQPIDSGLAFLVIPKTNYWNPFGAIGSLNRLPGLNASDVPAEGVDVLLQNWRPTDLGPRFISTESTTYRILGGLRGAFGAWDWEGALAYSANRTDDTESNRISKTLLAAELAKSTPDAINPFGGPNANTQEQWDRVRISNTNVGKTSLATGDFRVSNADLFQNWAGSVGAAFGVEWRRESYEENRDPRLDGTIIFSTENVSGISDVVGVSPTADSSASRNVFSGFGEVLVPLYKGEGAFINEWTLQVAARAEYFTDIEDGAVKPKAALSWFPVEGFNFRGAYSQGFRVPNLVQLNRGDVSRLNLGNEDYWREPVTMDPVSTGDAYLASVRQSNPDLVNEDTETIVAGAVWDVAHFINAPWLNDFRLSVDYWRFEQTGIIGAFGDQEALALDFLLRTQGSSNPFVVRADVTSADQAAFDAWNAANPGDQRQAAGQVLYVLDPYINLDSQTADGLDFGLAASFDAGAIGSFDVDIESTYLMTLDVVRNEQLEELAQDPAFAGEFATLAVDRIELNGNPKWRTSASLRWRKDQFGAGASLRHVSGFNNTSADLDLNDDGIPEFWRVDSNMRLSVYGEYRLKIAPDDTLRLRFGVNNVLDEAPPLLDESLGYSTTYHSVKGREFYFQATASF